METITGTGIMRTLRIWSFRIIYLTLILVGCITPIVHWIKNPEMTQMQVIMEIWWCYVLILVGIVMAGFDKGLRYEG